MRDGGGLRGRSPSFVSSGIQQSGGLVSPVHFGSCQA